MRILRKGFAHSVLLELDYATVLVATKGGCQHMLRYMKPEIDVALVAKVMIHKAHEAPSID